MAMASQSFSKKTVKNGPSSSEGPEPSSPHGTEKPTKLARPEQTTHCSARSSKAAPISHAMASFAEA